MVKYSAMKLCAIVPAIALLLLASTCPSDVQPDVPWFGKATLGEQFELPSGGTVSLDSESVQITFIGVVLDGRCPMDVRCRVQGSVEVELDVTTGSDQQATIILSNVWSSIYSPMTDTQIFNRHTLDTLGYRITLLEVSPYPEYHDRPIPPEDYAVRLHVTSTWSEESINLLSYEMTEFFEVHIMDDFYIKSSSIDGDSLAVTVQYSGCIAHDFYLLGSCTWFESDPPLMQAVLLHNSNGDTCKALVTHTVKFSLAPLRSCGGVADSLLITFADDSISVTFAL